METPREQWNKNVLRYSGSFLQSFEWGEFQRAFGRHAIRFRCGTFLGQTFVHKLPLGWRYLYIPRGPLGMWAESEFDDWLAAFRQQKAASGAVFLRMDPPYDAQLAVLKRNCFKDIGRSVQPRQNLIIDIRKSEEELLAGMHDKTRYNIHVAERHRVQVTISKIPARTDVSAGRQDTDEFQIPNSKSFEMFYRLLRDTERKQEIKLHQRTYYEEMLETIPEFSEPYILHPAELRRRLYIAFYQKKPLAAALILYFGNRATYLHGGSTSEHKNVMAPYALHWQIIRDAKAVGFEEYDMGGVDEMRWPGLTRFKRGFGGSIEEFLNAYEIPFSRIRYRPYRLTRFLPK